jgi:CubicO group peptidase (beta-lactamase class C family)
VYAAAILMRLVDQGLATVDSPVVEILPEFRVADAEVSERVTVRHLLCHTSGISGAFFHDTGRGDDCLMEYVQACAELPQSQPLGGTLFLLQHRVHHRWPSRRTAHRDGLGRGPSSIISSVRSG